MTPEEIQHKIEQELPGSKVVVQDPRKDGVHLNAIVTYKGFEGKTLIEQHRMVYDTLKEELKEEVHALGLETKTPDTADVKGRIEQLVGSKKVFLFMKGTPQMPECGFSMRASQALMQLGVDFDSFNVLTDEEVRQGIKDFANWPTIPQLYIDGKFIGGCDIIEQMASSGELQKLVA